MDEKRILEVFANENTTVANNISQLIKEIKPENSEQNLLTILSSIKIIKSNAHIMDCQSLERLCNGFEEIIVAVLTKNLLFTSLLSDFILEVNQVILNQIDDIKNETEFKTEEIEKWIVDCDRIASGMILETASKNEKDSVQEEEQEQSNVVVSSKRLNEMLRTFDDISIQRARLKQQSAGLATFDSAAGSEYIRLRKSIELTIKDLESLLQSVQENLLEAGMIRISHTLNEFQIKNFDSKCKIKIEETDLVLDKKINSHLVKILNLFLQNSMEYGFANVEFPCVQVRAKSNGSLIELSFKDNGNGIDLEELRKNIISTFPQRKKEIEEMDEEGLGMFLFATGMTPVETGLHAAWKEIEKIKGRLKIHTAVGEGTEFTVLFPKSLSSETGFTIRYGDSKFFIPSNYVVESVSKTNSELVTDTAKPYFLHRDQKIRIYRLSSILSTDKETKVSSNQDSNTILIIEYLELKFGLIVDDVINFSSKAIKNVPNQLKGIEEVSGIVIDENYDIIPVLNVPSLIKRFTWLREYDLKRTEVAARKVVKNILVVDPSEFAQHIVRSIFESNGFYIEVANDGIEALEIMKKKKFSLVVSAVEMPRMNGLTLLDNIKRNKEYESIQFILFPFEATEEIENSYLELGANFVIQKNNFDRNKLVNAARGLINE